jgi:hypothetical protein
MLRWRQQWLMEGGQWHQLTKLAKNLLLTTVGWGSLGPVNYAMTDAQNFDGPAAKPRSQRVDRGASIADRGVSFSSASLFPSTSLTDVEAMSRCLNLAACPAASVLPAAVEDAELRLDEPAFSTSA